MYVNMFFSNSFVVPKVGVKNNNKKKYIRKRWDGLRTKKLKCKISNKPNFPQPIALHFGGFVLIVSTDSHAAPPPRKTLQIYVAFQKNVSRHLSSLIFLTY